MKSLAVQAGSGSLSGTERSMLNTEYQALVSEVERISNDTEFAGTTLVGGSIVVDTASATAFAAAQGVQAITFVGDHSTASDATITYDNTNGAFSVSVVDGAATNIFSGSIPSGTNDGTSMTTGTVVTLTNTGSSNKIDIALNTAFVVNTAHATGTLDLSGTGTSSFIFKVGTGTSATADELTVSIGSVSASSIGVSTTSVSTKTASDLSSVAISNAIDRLQDHRATIGASQNRLEFASANLATAVENTEAARSQLLDLDIAAEMSNFVSKQILIQAGVAMLSQANQLPVNLLRLFE
jgi:flagellin